MSRNTHARVAGITFLLYIAAGITSVVLVGRATAAEGIAAKLAGIAAHETGMRVTVLLDMVQCFSALVLGVTLFAITRHQDQALATAGLVCRVVEGALGAVGIPGTLALLWLATATGPDAPDARAAQVLASYLLRESVALTATFFAAASTLFSWLLLRGRMVPAWLGWLGVVASVLLVVILPLRLAGFVSGSIVAPLWLPMLVFEVGLAFCLIVRGVPPVEE